MINSLSPILSFRKKMKKVVESKNKSHLKALSTKITESRESIDTTENS